MRVVNRVQTGVRVERRILQVSKALAEMLGIPLGELIEGVLLHSFDGLPPFGPATRRKIAQLRNVYGLELTAEDSHKLAEGRDDGRG